MYKFLLLFVFAFIKLYGQSDLSELDLQEAIDIGLRNNPEIKKAKENISANSGKFWSAISLPQPEVNLIYEYVPNNRNLAEYGERSLEITQSFEFPSNYFLKGNKFSKEEAKAFHLLKLTEREITAEIKSSYYKVLVKDLQLKNAEENVIINKEFSEKADIRYNVGEAENLERITAKVLFTESLNTYESIKNELETAYAELNYSLGFGKSQRHFYKLTDTLGYNPDKVISLSLDQLFNHSIESNQDIKISELNISTANIDNNLAWSSLLPEFNIGYFKQSLSGDNNFYGASFGISVPLWFLFDNRGQIQEASANVNIAEAELESAKNNIYLLLKSTFNNYKNNIKQVELYLNDILPQAEEIFRIAYTSYNNGEITYLEFLQARQTLNNAKSNYINILFYYNLSIVTLEKYLGKNLSDIQMESK